ALREAAKVADPVAIPILERVDVEAVDHSFPVPSATHILPPCPPGIGAAAKPNGKTSKPAEARSRVPPTHKNSIRTRPRQPGEPCRSGRGATQDRCSRRVAGAPTPPVSEYYSWPG